MKLAVQDTINRSSGRPWGAFWFRVARILAAAFILLAALFWNIPAGIKSYGYATIRELVKVHTIIGTWQLEKLTSNHYYIKFRAEDRNEAELVLATAEFFYQPVMEEFNFTPRGKIPIILYSSREALNKSFGWEADESAMGVYWAGSIRVLSPGVWVEEKEDGRIAEVFTVSGPMAHELTHLVVDYLTGGNYPRWFTEGVAQYEEYKLTGFEFQEASGSLKPPFYSMHDLTEHFDSMPSQTRAYGESLAAVRFIVHHAGESALYQIISELGQGMDFNQAAVKVLCLDEAQFEAGWQDWAVTKAYQPDLF
ncbi:MAG: peptidase MA family metallohydrolase [Desulfotomaculaceae bacterium]|nr:peptidase MA family metallohydrolase [Desulfotomaculaceae bacterium]